MALSITQTTFVTSQKSGLATVDVYGKTVDPIPINTGSNLKKKANLVMDNLLMGKAARVLQGRGDKILDTMIKGSPNDLNKMFSSVEGLLGNKKELLKEVKSAALTDVFTGLGYGDKAQVLTGMVLGDRSPTKILEGLGKLSPNMGIVVDGITKVINAGDLKSATGIAKVLGELTGNSKLVEVLGLGAEATALSGLLAKANMFRIPELTDLILAKVKDKRTRKKLLLRNAENAARYSDLHTLNKIIEDNTGIGLYSVYPHTVKTILANYRTNHGMSPTKEDYNELMTLLEKIEPKWWESFRNGVRHIRADYFYRLSEHARLALLNHEELKYWTTINGLYPELNPTLCINKYRPWIKLPEPVIFDA